MRRSMVSMAPHYEAPLRHFPLWVQLHAQVTGRCSQKPGLAGGGDDGCECGEVGEAGVVREHLDDGLREAEAALRPEHVLSLVPQHERDGRAGATGARRAAGAMEVRLVVLGRVEVDDDVDI